MLYSEFSHVYFNEYFDYTYLAVSARVSTVHFICPVIMICLMYSNVFVAFYFKPALSLLYFLCFFPCGRTPLCLFYVRCMFSPCWMDQCVSFTHREFSPDLTVSVETLDSFRRLRWPCLAWCFCPCVHILCCLTLIMQPTTETFPNFTQQLSYSFIRGTVTFFFFLVKKAESGSLA